MVEDALKNTPELHVSNNSINKEHISWGCWPFPFIVMLMLRDRAAGWRESERGKGRKKEEKGR